MLIFTDHYEPLRHHICFIFHSLCSGSHTVHYRKTCNVRLIGHNVCLCLCDRAETLCSQFFQPTMDTTVGSTEDRQLPWVDASPGQSSYPGSVPESSFVITASTESLATQYTTLSALQGSFISIQQSPNSAEFQSLQAIILRDLDSPPGHFPSRTFP